MLPVEHNDPVNAKILAISEDKIEGFVREPFEEIARRSDVSVATVMERIAAMLRAGTVRRVRQTLLATNLADGALVAWKVAPEKIAASRWSARAAETGLAPDEFFRIAESLNSRKVIGRFSTFLEHVKPSAGGVRVTRFNALVHWAVPPGREIETGGEVGRHHILTHCYWREAGPEFKNVNIMAVAHGTDKQLLLDHKAAIDRHLDL